MTVSTALLCSDGSDLAGRALAAALGVLSRPERYVVATVVDRVDPSLVLGSGFAGGVATPEEAEQMRADRLADAHRSIASVRAALSLPDAESVVVEDDSPGRALCELAESLGASVMAIGSHGHGGLRRAVLGSVSDHIVRHAPCPVVVVRVDE